MPPKNAGVLPKVRCQKCQEWTTPDLLSTRQQEKLSRKVKERHFDAEHAEVTCRSCNDDVKATMIQCDRCGIFREAGDYSRNSIRENQYNCRRCVGWKENLDPGNTPFAEPSGHFSPEELPKEKQIKTDSQLVSDEVEGPRAPISSPAALGLENTPEMAATLAKHLSGMGLGGSRAPASVRLAGGTSTIDSQVRVAASIQEPRSGIPDRMRKIMATRSSAAQSTVSTATTLREGSSETATTAPRSFNAWDARGRQYRRAPNPASSTVESSAQITSGAPSQTSENVPAGSRNNGPRKSSEWHKPDKLTSKELLDHI